MTRKTPWVEPRFVTREIACLPTARREHDVLLDQLGDAAKMLEMYG
ncbi:hypothetical protein ACVINW_004072 [Bradyrhizobium sp. USDA 4461]